MGLARKSILLTQSLASAPNDYPTCRILGIHSPDSLLHLGSD